MRRIIVLCLSMVSLASFAQDDFDKQQIIERIRPVGSVRIQGKSEAPVAVTTAVKEPVKMVPGQETYDKYCFVCHKTGLAGAPKFHNAADWKPHIANKTIDQLVASATKGVNAMPPKGTCADCTDAQLKEAIQYMLPPK